jgi:hypothetical protein
MVRFLLTSSPLVSVQPLAVLLVLPGEYVNQVRTSGHVTSGARIWTAAGGGALAGGIAGFTLGIGAGAGVTAGAIETGIVTAFSTVIGDVTQHRANDALGLTSPGENNTELSNTLVNAATAGMGGSVGGAVADRLFPIPNVRREIQLLQFASRRSTRAARIQAASVRHSRLLLAMRRSATRWGRHSSRRVTTFGAYSPGHKASSNSLHRKRRRTTRPT